MIFNRYWISDRSGHGVGKWRYFTGDMYDNDEYACDYIIDRYEDWARWADSYSMDIEYNVEPTREFLEQELDRMSRKAVFAVQRVAELRELLGYSQGLVL